MYSRTLTSIAVALMALTLGAGLNAATITWDGGGDGTTWTDAANWDTDTVPTLADEAVFDGTVAPTAVVDVSGIIQRLSVDSGANPALNISFDLSGDLTLLGLTASALQVGVDDAAGFGASASQTLTVESGVNVDGSLTLDANVTLQTATAAVEITLGDGSVFDVAGVIEVLIDTILVVDATSAATSIDVGELHIDTTTFDFDTLGGNPEATFGDITFAGAFPYFGGFGSLSTAERWEVTVTGNIDGGTATDAMIESDFIQFVFPNASTIQSTGTFDFCWMGRVTVPVGGSLTVSNGLYTGDENAGNMLLIYQLRIAGTFNAGDNSLWIAGHPGGTSAVAIEVDAGATYSHTGLAVLWYGIGNEFTLSGTFTMGGEVRAYSDVWLVSLGSDITFAGEVQVNDADFGADEDGATTTDMATLRFDGNFTVDATGRLLVGEGMHYFAADLDLSAADQRVVPPGNSNTDPQIHFTGGAQTLSFSQGGSYFALHSVAPTTSITHNGLCILADDMDLSGSTQADVWTSTVDSDIQVGDGSFGVEGTLTIGNANATFQAFTIPDVSNGDIFEASSFTILRAPGDTGVILLQGNLDIRGDQTEDDVGAAVKDEFNASTLVIDGAEVELDPAALTPLEILIGDGANDGEQYGPPPNPPAVLPVDYEGNGATLEVINGAMLSAVLIKAGYAETNSVTGVPAPPLSEISGARLQVDSSNLFINLTGTGNGITTGHYGQLELLNTTVRGEGSYQIVSVPESQMVVFFNCDIDRGTAAGGTPSVRLFLGGLNVFLVDNQVKSLNSSGIQLRPNVVVRAFSGNLITDNTGQGGGTTSHISLQGLGAGSAEFWDNNHFDDSVNTGAGGLFVNNSAGDNPVVFRTPSTDPDGFGVPGFAVTAAQAETFDNDGTGLLEVRWDDAANELVAIDEGAGLPAGLISDDTLANQSAMLFGLNAASGNHSVDAVTVSLSASGTTLSDSDIASATLFDDANGNGFYDAGEEFAAGTLDQPLTNGEVTFDLLGAGVSQAINAGTTVHWGVAITFAASANGLSGNVEGVLAPGSIVLSNAATGIVAGLPIFSDLTVSGPPVALRMVTQPGGALAGAALSPQPVVEVIDAEGNRVDSDNTTTVTAAIGTDPAGGSTLGGTTTVTVVDGVATFTNLSVNQAGTGFTLDFSAAGLTGVSSASFNVTAAPPPSNGGGGGDDDDDGCSTGGSSSWTLLALFAALAGITATRRLTARRP